MGLSLSTTSQTCSQYATFRGQIICTIIRPLALEVRGGAFDAPSAKCPPERGSSNWVTDSSASYFPYNDSPTSSPSSAKSPISDSPLRSHKLQFNHSSISARNIPSSRASSNSSTPSLTPDSDSDDDDTKSNVKEKDGLDFLMTLFPRHGLSAFPHSKSVTISAPNMGVEFNGIVLHVPGTPKTFYVDGKSAQSINLRESIVALLDLADDQLGCDSLIIVLERSSPHLGALLHSLMYVGGTVVTKPLYPVDPGYVFVGLEI